MQIGLVTDSLSGLPLPDLMDTAAALGITALEFGCGNWSAAPHLDLDELLADPGKREALRRDLRARGLSVSALNCSGNPLHPGEPGRRHREVTVKTLRLAALLEVDRVVMMSGCPGGPGDTNANWITTAWPPEAARVLAWQWEAVVLPYWSQLVRDAEQQGVRRLCLELHGQQNVFNVASFRRLRDAVGPVVGVNFDPSHLFWMGADPLAALPMLAGSIYHVHAKDTLIEPGRAAVNGLLDVTPTEATGDRSWRYVTLGDGHGTAWWAQFCQALRAAGYDDVLSIEHEDLLLPPETGVRRSVGLLLAVIA